MNILETLRNEAAGAAAKLWGLKDDIVVSHTPKEYEGDFTIVCFPLARISKLKPEETGAMLGKELSVRLPFVSGFNVVKGFLNISLKESFWAEVLQDIDSGRTAPGPQKQSGTVIIEYCSPNTNKPLHLGHLRNIFIGHSIGNLLESAGYKVIRTCLYNDRGTNISKSMIAWKRWGEGRTPAAASRKGDHFAGEFYVMYEKAYREALSNAGLKPGDNDSGIELASEMRSMTLKWEQGDPETRNVWEMMNGWVYGGFNQTYERLGVSFDKFYYESETYGLGKAIVDEGLAKGVFFRKEDGSVWINMVPDGLDEKAVLRADGTSVYITQDLGTAQLRFDEYNPAQSLYVVADEQDYHFKVLFLILKKLGKPWAERCRHVSYGMVDLPEGKMKSREGNVVDADELIDEMEETAGKHTRELGKIEEFSGSEAQRLYHIIGMGALKFFLLKVAPRKRMLFNPEESVDFHGFTGPFIQYTYARIRSILRKWEQEKVKPSAAGYTVLQPQEKELVKYISQYPAVLEEAISHYDPSVVANYVYHLAKSYNKFYTDLSVLGAEGNAKGWRVALSRVTGDVIRRGMGLLGIEVPERM